MFLQLLTGVQIKTMFSAHFPIWVSAHSGFQISNFFNKLRFDVALLKHFLFLGHLLCLAALPLCGLGVAGALDAETTVQNKALERWNLLIEADFEQAYRFLSPAYRQAVPYRVYRKSIGGAVQWLSADVQSSQCDTDTCQVKVKINYHTNIRGYDYNLTKLFDETWILVDGDWWYFQEI